MTVYENLSLTLSSYLSWRAHNIKNSSKSFQKIKPPKAIEIQLRHHTLEVLFKSLVCSSLEYADVVWDGFSESDRKFSESLQIEGARVVTSALKGTNWISLLNEFSWVKLTM